MFAPSPPSDGGGAGERRHVLFKIPLLLGPLLIRYSWGEEENNVLDSL